MNSTKTATNSIWVILTVLVGFGMFVMKNRVQNLETELFKINTSIQEDTKTIHVLKAEWAHLNSPSRLRKLAEKYARLNKVRAEQIINYSALPFDYEPDESDRRVSAQKNLSLHAEKNRNLKVLAKSQR